MAEVPDRPPIQSHKNKPKRKTERNYKVMCLSNPERKTRPNDVAARERLRGMGLGLQIIRLSSTASATDVEAKLEEVYPKLKCSGGFDFLIQHPSEPIDLTLIEPPPTGCDSKFLHDKFGARVIYIRPKRNLDNSCKEQQGNLESRQSPGNLTARKKETSSSTETSTVPNKSNTMDSQDGWLTQEKSNELPHTFICNFLPKRPEARHLVTLEIKDGRRVLRVIDVEKITEVFYVYKEEIGESDGAQEERKDNFKKSMNQFERQGLLENAGSGNEFKKEFLIYEIKDDGLWSLLTQNYPAPRNSCMIKENFGARHDGASSDSSGLGTNQSDDSLQIKKQANYSNTFTCDNYHKDICPGGSSSSFQRRQSAEKNRPETYSSETWDTMECWRVINEETASSSGEMVWEISLGAKPDECDDKIIEQIISGGTKESDSNELVQWFNKALPGPKEINPVPLELKITPDVGPVEGGSIFKIHANEELPNVEFIVKFEDYGERKASKCDTRHMQGVGTIPKEIRSNKEDILHDEEKICQRFEDMFIDSKHKLKKEVHEKLTCFAWLSGAYGLTAPTKKMARPHIYLTVKRGMKKSDVRRDLEEKFHCDAKLYFELLQEPKRKPKFEFLGKCSSTMTRKWIKSSSLPPTPGGGILACIKNSATISDPLQMPEEMKRQDLPVQQGTGTLTMFCAHNNEHYALTCFHVGCATDETHLNATLNKKEDIEAIRSSLPTYEKYAKEQQYYFAEKVAKNNNDLISFGDVGRKYTLLGNFDKHHFDKKCDIMSLKVTTNAKIKCTMTGVASPNWDSIGKELYERVFKGNDIVNVEKTGFSSDVSHGQIVPCDFSYKLGTESLFQDAYVVKGYSRPFLEGGDSGSAVFFQDNNDEKQIFAYGVCEMDELPIIKRHESRSVSSHENAHAEQATTPVKDDCDNSSIWSEDKSDDEVEFQEDITGPYFICLSLHTALEKLGLHEVTCVSECSLKRLKTQAQLQI